MTISQHAIPESICKDLATLREEENQRRRERKEKLEQADIARALSPDRPARVQSRVSRIESGEAVPTPDEVEKYLRAIGSEDAVRCLGYLEQRWNRTPVPSFLHPHRDALYQADQALAALEKAAGRLDGASPLQKRVAVLREGLTHSSAFLASVEHPIAFTGAISSGKSSFISVSSGLRLPGELTVKSLSQLCALETGGGRTTLPEVRVRHVPTSSGYEIRVVAKQEDEVRKLVENYCETILPSRPDEVRVPREVSKELARAIRNQAGLSQAASAGTGGEDADPEADLVEDVRRRGQPGESRKDLVERLKVEVLRRMNLPHRTCTSLSYDAGCGQAPLEWLKKTFMAVNRGLLPDVPLPDCITVVVPEPIYGEVRYGLSLIDTRGVNGSAIREDIVRTMTDPRTLVVLCSRFETAPDSETQELIQHAHETQASGTVAQRLAMLVLPRGEAGDREALKMTYDDGLEVQTDREGYKLRRKDIDRQLVGLPIKPGQILFNNVVLEDPREVVAALVRQIDQIREAHAVRIRDLALDVEKLAREAGEAATLRAQEEVNTRITIFLRQHSRLPRRDVPIHTLVLNAVLNGNAQQVWAMTTRSGRYANFDIYFLLGEAAVRHAKARSEPFFAGLNEQVLSITHDARFAAAHGFMEQLHLTAVEWRQDFLDAARVIGQETYRSELAADAELWEACSGYYGPGRRPKKVKYVDMVAQELEDWFAKPSAARLAEMLEAQIVSCWDEQVIKQFRELCGKELAVPVAS